MRMGPGGGPGGERICIGVDVGGTFTDAVLTDGVQTWRAKAPTTPGRLGDGVLAATRLVAGRSGRSIEELLPDVKRFGLGTTAVTNTLASRTGRKVGLITTKGFEGMLPFAQGARVIDEDGWIQTPPLLVPKHAIAAINERIDRDGRVVIPLDTAEVLDAVTRLVEVEQVEAVAVSYLWSFANPVHETASVEAITEAYPGLPVVSGAALHPAIREYERTTYAVMNAYVSGALGGIEELEVELAALGLGVPGPAAGVAASVAVAAASGVADLVTCDMGGTSFDVSVISNGRAARRTRGRLMGAWTALSLVDVESIG